MGTHFGNYSHAPLARKSTGKAGGGTDGWVRWVTHSPDRPGRHGYLRAAAVVRLALKYLPLACVTWPNGILVVSLGD